MISGLETEMLTDADHYMVDIFRIQDGHGVYVGSCSYNVTAVMVSGLEPEIVTDVGHFHVSHFENPR